MSGFQAGRLFRRATEVQSTLVSAHRQLHSTPARPVAKGTYNVSKLVLDLDATNNEFVRSVESIGYTPITRPQKPKITQKARLKRPQRQANFDTSNWNFKTISGSEAAQSDLAKCRSLVDVEDFLNRVTQTADGCRWLVSNAQSVKRMSYPITIKNNKDNDNTTRIAPSRYKNFDSVNYRNLLNQTIENIEAHGIEMGAYLCATALSFSLKYRAIADDPACARRYLDIMISRGYWESSMGDELNPQNNINYYIVGMRNHVPSSRNNPQMLTLLTGWHVDGRPSPSEQQQPCLRNFVRNIEGYATYIQAIGNLRSSNGLWHEWDNYSVSSPTLYLSAVERAALFTEAFLRANDTWSALSVLKQAALVVNADGHLPAIVNLVRELINSQEAVFVSWRFKGVFYDFLELSEQRGIPADDNERQEFEAMVQYSRKRHHLNSTPLSMPIASD